MKIKLRPAQVARWAISIAVFFVIWQIIGTNGTFFFIRPPTEVIPVLIEELREGEILAATAGTLQIAAVGFVVGALLGVTLGFVTGLSDAWAAVLDPLVNAALAAPVVMFIPVISIYAGLEFKAKVILVVLFNIFVIIVNTATGVREVPKDVKEMARAFGTSKRAMYTKIILPWASPYILTGLRLGVGRSVQGAILADLFLLADNLGLYIVNSASSFELARLLAAVLFITILAAGTMLIARMLEWWLLRWTTP
jgi:ABC-type nitrate/sulfonate/bicarbonate transport system permease component